MRPVSRILCAVACAAVLLTACGGETTRPGGGVARVSLVPTALTLVQGEQAQLSALALDAQGNRVETEATQWSSSAPQVASVSSSGQVTAVAAGTATVTAANQGKSGAAEIIVVPPPVASVRIAPADLRLVSSQTAQLTAQVRDRDSTVLTGRTVTWSSTVPSVATVSTTGVVTGVATGTALVTATSEGRSDVVTVEVAEGGFVQPSGGTVVSSDSAVRIAVPSGALPSGTAITITPSTAALAAPVGSTVVRGTAYTFGPDGLQFTSPATVVIRYDPLRLPRWVTPADLVLQRWDGTQWSRLTNIVVDSAAKTISGRTPGFSTVGVYFLNPSVTLEPAPAHVNAQQRSVVLRATVSGEGRLPDAFQYVWSNTASNGTLSVESGTTAQYIALTPILPAGDIDGITLQVRGQFEPGGPFEDIAVAHTTIKSDLELTLHIEPEQSLLQYGQSVSLGLVVRDARGNLPYSDSPDLRYEWTATSSAGEFSLPSGRITLGRGSYTAFPASRQSSVSPKGDKVTARVKLVTFTLEPLPISGRFKLDSTDTDLGTVEAFIQVIPQYQVQLTPVSSQLRAGESVLLQATTQPPWAESEQLFYRYRLTGSQGTLSVAQGVQLTQRTVTYTAAESPSGGTDFVDVELIAGAIGLVGSARAAVSVDARSATLRGSMQVSAPVALDAGRQCVAAYIVFPLAPDATTYDMHAYGFNDTAFWGTSIRRTFSSPLPAFSPCSLSGWGTSGVVGNEYRFYLTGFAGPANTIGSAVASFNTRFAGIQVDVTAR